MDKELKHIGLRLAKLRKNSDVSISELSEITKIHTRNLAYFENGDRLPTLKQLNKLCNYYKVSPDYLIFGDFYEIIKDKINNENRGEILKIIKGYVR